MKGVIRIKKKKIKLIIMGVTLTSVLAMFNCLMPKSKPQKPHSVAQIEHNYEREYKLDEETIKGEVLKKLELKIADINFSQEATIGSDNKFLKGIFKNQKHIKYYTMAHYSIDFQNINNEQISVNDNKIVLILPSPKVEINILENKTEFFDEKGILAFGEPELTAEQHALLMRMVKETVTEKALAEENMGEIKEYVKEQIEDLLEDITKKEYTINIRWV